MHRFYFVRCGWTYDPSSAHYPDSGRRSVCHSIRFWTLGTGHSYDLHFELQVPFQALHIVTSGFSVYDSDLIGKYFHYSVPCRDRLLREAALAVRSSKLVDGYSSQRKWATCKWCTLSSLGLFWTIRSLGTGNKHLPCLCGRWRQWKKRILMQVQWHSIRSYFNAHFLVMTWGSLRSSAVQRMDLQKIIYHAETMRGGSLALQNRI